MKLVFSVILFLFGGESIQLGELFAAKAFILPVQWSGFTDLESSEIREESSQMELSLGYTQVKGLNVPFYQHLYMFENNNIVDNLVYSFHLIALKFPPEPTYVFYVRTSWFNSGEVAWQKIYPLSTRSDWIEAIKQAINQSLSEIPSIKPKNIYTTKKIEVTSQTFTNILGEIGKILEWQTMISLHTNAILIDRGAFGFSKMLSTLYSLPYKPYRSQDHLHIDVVHDIKRLGTMPFDITHIKLSANVRIINQVNAQSIYKQSYIWLDSNIDEAKGSFLTSPVMKDMMNDWQVKTPLLDEFNKPLRIVKQTGQWIYLNAGLKRGFKIGDRLDISTKNPKGEPVVVKAHIIRYYSSGLGLICPETNKLVNDGSIAYLRDNPQALEKGQVVERDPTLYPKMPDHIENYLTD